MNVSSIRVIKTSKNPHYQLNQLQHNNRYRHRTQRQYGNKYQYTSVYYQWR